MKINQIFKFSAPDQVNSISVMEASFYAISFTKDSIIVFNEKSQNIIETRSDSITHLISFDLIPGNVDLVAGDSDGNLISILNCKQILHQENVGASVTCIAAYHCGSFAEIIVGDSDGNITALDSFLNRKWRLRLQGFENEKERPTSIKCMLPVKFMGNGIFRLTLNKTSFYHAMILYLFILYQKQV